LKIDEVNLRQVENDPWSLILNPFAEFIDVIDAHPADQPQNYPRTVFFCFNPEH